MPRLYERSRVTPPLSNTGEHPLAPLLTLAHEKSPDERGRWLAAMRADAPTLVAALEHLLRPDRSNEVDGPTAHRHARDCRPANLALRWVGHACWDT